MHTDLKKGKYCSISKEAIIGKNVTVGHNCIIEKDVVIGDNVYIDSNSIIRQGTRIGKNSFIGSNCIIGEYWTDFCKDKEYHEHILNIDHDALIRSGTIIYSGSEIGFDFQTGHQVTIREKVKAGNHVSIGTLSDIQGNCNIGDYVRMHSNVHVGQLSKIDSFVWIFPYVVLTNDPTPPSENFIGVHIHSFAIIATNATIMPGMEIQQDSLVAAGAVVTKNVEKYTVVAGNPAKAISDIRNVKNKITGETVYPWKYHFNTYMPWEKGNFEKWVVGLSDEEKKHYGFDVLETCESSDIHTLS